MMNATKTTAAAAKVEAAERVILLGGIAAGAYEGNGVFDVHALVGFPRFTLTSTKVDAVCNLKARGLLTSTRITCPRFGGTLRIEYAVTEAGLQAAVGL